MARGGTVVRGAVATPMHAPVTNTVYADSFACGAASAWRTLFIFLFCPSVSRDGVQVPLKILFVRRTVYHFFFLRPHEKPVSYMSIFFSHKTSIISLLREDLLWLGLYLRTTRKKPITEGFLRQLPTSHFWPVSYIYV